MINIYQVFMINIETQNSPLLQPALYLLRKKYSS